MVTWIDQSELVEMAKVQSGASIMRDLYRRDGNAEDFAGRIEFLPIEEGLFCSVN